jgi:hypothetical protein
MRGPGRRFVQHLAVLEDGLEEAVLHLRDRAAWNLIDRYVERVQHLDEACFKQEPLGDIQLRSPPRRVTGIKRDEEFQAEDLEALGGQGRTDRGRHRLRAAYQVQLRPDSAEEFNARNGISLLRGHCRYVTRSP